jgi:predicted Fe-S protein YdhL (DUF1289 family)
MPIPSPCNKICTMDSATGTCAGCRRTLSEIATWGVMADAERLRVLSALADRPWPQGMPQSERS